MAYQALYRKYRPCIFDEVVGQDIANKTLKNALVTNRVSHAYLFSGPRGIGKTTLAKILAKAVNCLNLNDGNPCQVCSNCLESAKRECTDIIEIDAASNNGVDEIRELKNKINLVPTALNYKVYIIDEVHMLSTGAFNALLKTLEEPPSHVIFILATTDLNKVPVTIVSRCQCFNLKRIKVQDIVERLKLIVKNENISIDSEVLEEIAKFADGGMRDAVGLLDKLTSYTSDRITLENMREINGLISQTEIILFIEKVKANDVLFILNKIAYLYDNGKDFIFFTEELILELRNQLVEKYTQHDDNIDSSWINKFALALNHTLSELKNSNNKRVLLEIELLSFMSSSSEKVHSDEKIISREIKVEQKFDNKTDVNEDNLNTNLQKTSIKEEKENIGFEKRQDLRISNTFALATREDLNFIKKQWKTISNYTIDCDVGVIACFLTDGTPAAASKNNLIITFEYASLIERGNSMLEDIEKFINKIANINYKVVLLTTEQWLIEKKKYISNKKNNIIYEYVNEDNTSINYISKYSADNSNKQSVNGGLNELSELTKSTIQLFGNKVVKIEE
ncbi:MAG: DNA polymerase III subunit gamma/tau [Bacilli bacterium]